MVVFRGVRCRMFEICRLGELGIRRDHLINQLDRRELQGGDQRETRDIRI